MGIFGFFNKAKKETLDKGLEKTKTSVFDKLARAVAGKSKVDDDVLDNLEEVLIGRWRGNDAQNHRAHRNARGTRQVCVYFRTEWHTAPGDSSAVG